MKKKKADILFLCQFFYPEYVSSATLPFDTAKRLTEEGFSVEALCGYPKEYFNGGEVPMNEEVDGIKITRVKYLQLDKKSAAGRLTSFISFTAAILFRFFKLKNYKYVVVYSNPPMLPIVCALAKKSFGTGFVFVAYDLYPEIAIQTGAASESGLISRVMKVINKMVFPSADRIVALSSEMKEFITHHRKVDEAKITVIPNWYEDLSDQYRTPDPASAFTEKYKGKFVVSYLGNMGTCQDMDTVMDCARLLKDNDRVRFLLAGHGNKTEAIKQMIEAEKLENIDFYDFLHGKDYHDALAVSGCSIVSLTQGVTGLCSPSKAYGYMMAGNPVIAIMDESDIVADIRKFNMGCHIQNGEAEKMADFICRLVDHPAEAAEMKENSVKVFKEKYTTAICTKEYAELFKNLI